MSMRSIDALTRRASMRTLGGAALAATAARPSVSEAKRKKKKKKKCEDCGKKEEQRCSQDTAVCLTVLEDACKDENEPEECVETLSPCCETCSAAGLLECFLEQLEP